jgi:hypothetical protein
MSEIQKMAVYDSRIVQEAPAYGIQKGGLSYSNSPFNAIASTSSQMSFNVNVPSQNVFLDREVLWTATCDLQVDIVVPGVGGAPTPPNPSPVLGLGSNASLAPFPLHQCVSTMTATINDTVSTINTSDVLNEVLRFVNQKKNRLQRTCPTMLDKYANYAQVPAQLNNPQNGYNNATDYDNVPNGAFWNVQFTDANGNVLVGNGNYLSGLPAGAGNASTQNFVNGVPVYSNDSTIATNSALNYRLFVRFTSTEKLILSPFIFSEECGDETGLFGLNNIQLVMNFQNPAKLLRTLPTLVQSVAPTNFTRQDATIAFRNAQPWTNARINCLFITPSLDLALPPKSVVPYLEYPRFLFNSNQAIPANSSITLTSQTIVLPQIPDMLVIYCKPRLLDGNPINNPQFGDFYLPMDNISINFDNYSGLLSSHTPEQLYNITVDNGLEMDWNAWNGLGYSVVGGGDRANLVGGFLVLRFGKDIQLQSAQASGVIGNYTLQYNVRVNNRFDVPVSDLTLFTMTVNSGFFETQAGSSRILKGPITESDVIGARENASVLTRTQLERMVGGSFWSKLGTALNKAKDILMNPAVRSAVKTIGKQTPLKGVVEMAEKAGYGMSGGLSYSGGMSRSGGRKKAGLHSLM